LTLSSDHRVVDGAGAAGFLRDLVKAILNPLQYFNSAGNTDGG
jgi:pyruvate/2-oxoglutarate dehydrogenase complex dihydrolipoamide acyltransferase (E2) component